MKKQILKFTQLAKENIGGAERTETLTEKQVEAEKRAKAVRSLVDDVNHQISATVTGSSHEVDKRQKGLPINKLGLSMEKAAEQLAPETILGLVMKDGADCEKDVAFRQAETEISMDRQVYKNMKSLLKTEGQKLDTQREKLSSARLTMDTFASQLANATKYGNSDKIPSLQSELERASENFHRERESYSVKLNAFKGLEKEFAKYIVNYLRLQADFHRDCVAILEDRVSQLESRLDVIPQNPLFGSDLSQHLKSTGRKLATVIEKCIEVLWIRSLKTQGLFRLAGSASEIKKLKISFNNGLANCDDFLDDHVLADCLKQYLRELPDPLLTHNLYDDWLAAAGHSSEQERREALAAVVYKLPTGNYDNLKYLINFLSELKQFEDVNKMSARNIGLVIGPNLLWSRDTQELNATFAETPIMSRITEDLINNYSVIFCKGEKIVRPEEATNDPVAPPRRRRPAPQPPVRSPSTSSGGSPSVESERRPPPQVPIPASRTLPK